MSLLLLVVLFSGNVLDFPDKPPGSIFLGSILDA
jgi:hypothetical protein